MNEWKFTREYVQKFGDNPEDHKFLAALNRLHELEMKERAAQDALKTKTEKPAKPAPRHMRADAANASRATREEKAMQVLKSDTSGDAIKNAFLANLLGD